MSHLTRAISRSWDILRSRPAAIIVAVMMMAVAGVSSSAVAQQAEANPGQWVDVDHAADAQPGQMVGENADGEPSAESPSEVVRSLGVPASVIGIAMLSLIPLAVVTMTSFTRILIVLSLLRQGLGGAALPPTSVLMGLSLALSAVVMAPTGQRIYDDAWGPYRSGELTEAAAWDQGKQPIRDFMFDQIDRAENWDSVYLLLSYRGVDTSEPSTLQRADVDMVTLVPAFVLSELKVAFAIGFRLYLPLLVIDLVVASALSSMGMLMLPPVMVSLPFKLLLFVLVDGWHLVAGQLLGSFAMAVPGGG